MEAVTLTNADTSSREDETEPPAPKKRRLFDNYDQSTSTSDPHKNHAADEFRKYLKLCDNTAQLSCLEFWAERASVLPRLHPVALTVLAVPATSAPVERVFSRGGIFMRPHRARLSNKSLSNLVFMKCNLDKLQ